MSVPTLPLFVHERLSNQAILQSVRSRKRDKQETLKLFADEELDVADDRGNELMVVKPLDEAEPER